MSNIVDRVFSEVCLDERITDGIFRMEEETHMDALRDYFVKKGITKEVAVEVTNRMVEGKYPDRQAYRKEDGILVTWPSPKHKQKAMHENPGKYVEYNPFPKSPSEKPPPHERPPEPQPRPEKEEPAKRPKEEPDEEPDEDPDKGARASNLFGDTGKVTQGDKELDVEPARGEEKPEPPAPSTVMPTPKPKTPDQLAAEKEVVKQIIATDDTALTNVANPLNEECLKQLRELYKKADELGFKEAVTFLTHYVKP